MSIKVEKHQKFAELLSTVISNEAINILNEAKSAAICGGLPLSIMDDTQNITDTRDIDIFLFGEKENKLKFLQCFFSSFKKKAVLSIDKFSPIITIGVENFPWTIQIINTNHPTVMKVVSEFNFDICQLFICKNNIKTSEDVQETLSRIQDKTLTCKNEVSVTKKRAARYIQKGFKIKYLIEDFDADEYNFTDRFDGKYYYDDLYFLQEFKKFKEKNETFLNLDYFIVSKNIASEIFTLNFLDKTMINIQSYDENCEKFNRTFFAKFNQNELRMDEIKNILLKYKTRMEDLMKELEMLSLKK